MIKVNVIVPIYNAEKHLKLTLDSLVNQSIDSFELILVNDGSTDNSQEIIDAYKSKYPTLIRSYSKPNCGIAHTRNFGLQQVNSEYFGFVDSDDIVEPDMFEKLYLSAKENNSDCVFSDFYWTYPDFETRTNDGPYLDNKEILIKMFATLWNKLYRTDFIKQLELHFPDGYRYEDASFLYRLAPFIKKWSYVNIPFVHYRQTVGSITHNHNDRVKDMIYVFNDILNFYKENHLFNDYKLELEYLFIRFFLGNSFLRTCKIKDKNDRKLTLNLSYRILNNNFPDWRKNIYLKKSGFKNFYYRSITPLSYKLFAFIFHLIYVFKKESLH
ncbi:MAG TPA: glycosyltransferase [Erysipelotrichaceae bacterium]|nr:glycosyltransferase [Erysipelotrichaceae bacterium]